LNLASLAASQGSDTTPRAALSWQVFRKESAVPRFYFDVRDGPRFFADDEGRELDSLDAAEREAVTAAAQIGRDRLAKGDARAVTVEVRNEHGQWVLTVTVSVELHQVEPEPPRA
jgi:hypothetical protein